MHITINNKKYKVIDADSFIKKTKGLMFKKNIDYILRLRCNGIHTCFMRENIDIILTDKDNNIIGKHENLKKWRFLLPKKNVYYTYEFPKDTIKYIKDNKIKIED